MRVQFLLPAVAGALVTLAAVVTTVQASSLGRHWNLYASPQGARLSYTYRASFLGDDEVNQRLLFSAVCNPSEPTPYVTTLIKPAANVRLNASQNMKIHLGNGNYLFLLGTLDRLASVNAGDDLSRYGFSIKASSPFFQALAEEGSGFYPQIDADPGDGGVQLTVQDGDRQKVRSFLQACQGFAEANPSAAQSAELPYACRDYLNGPNSYANDVATLYPDQIVDSVCGSQRMDVRPAVCMHLLMSGAVPWNLKGDSTWLPENAATLCAESSNPGKRLDCFRRELAETDNWSSAISACNKAN